MPGVLVGMIIGVAIVAYLMLNKMDPFMGLHAGFFALCINFVVTIVISLLTAPKPNPLEE
jgi:Na+/proline symporter